MKLSELFESDEQSNLSAFLKKASNAVALAGKGHILWRGHDGLEDATRFAKEIGSIDNGSIVFFHVKGRQTPRESLTGSSLFLRLTKEMPAWKDLPSREKSTFASNNSHKAAAFGQVGIVLPFDSVNKFATIRHDFNLKPVPTPGGKRISLSDLSFEIDVMFHETIKFIRRCRSFMKNPTEFGDVPAEDYESLKKLIEKFGLADSDLTAAVNMNFSLNDGDGSLKREVIVGLGNYLTAVQKAIDHSEIFIALTKSAMRRVLVGFQNYFNIHQKNLYTEIEEVLSPDNMGIDLFNDLSSATKDMDKKLTTELWFEGDYLLIIGEGYHELSSLFSMKEFKELL